MHFRIKSSFTLRLTIPILLGVLASFAVTLVSVGYFVNQILLDNASNHSYSSLETSTLYINSNLQEIESAIANSVWLVEQYKDDTSTLHYITEKIVSDNIGVVGSIVALNPEQYNGMKFAGYSHRKGNFKNIDSRDISSKDYDYLAMDWYQIPMLLGKPIWSEPYYDDGGANEVVTTFSYPLEDKNGNIYAILTADLSLKWLTSKASSIKPYPNSRNLIISRNGSFVVNTLGGQSNSETIFSYALSEGADSTILKVGKRMLRGISDDFEFQLEGTDGYGVYGPLDNGWAIMIISSLSDVLRPNLTINLMMIAIAIIGILLVSIICIRLIKTHTRPIRQFSSIIHNISQNKLDNIIPVVNSKDEMRVLRDAIESMQQSIKENNDHRKDIQGARDIQTSIVPPQSLITDVFDLYALVDPAKEVGGDLYDYHVSKVRNKLYFLVGDVSGKGFPASLFMAMVVAAFKTTSRFCSEEKELVKNINNIISTENKLDMFVTLFFASLDLSTLKVTFCNAGHNSPVVVYPDGHAEFLKTIPNLVLGAFEGFEYQDQEIQLGKGYRIIVYSDGVTEAENAKKELYGEDRLLKWASSIPKVYSSHEATISLRKDISLFTSDDDHFVAQNDDITIMIITL